MRNELEEVFGDIFGLEPEEISDSLTSETVGNWDSLNHLRLVTAIEEAFGVTLSMADIEYMMGNFAKVREVLQHHLGAANAT